MTWEKKVSCENNLFVQNKSNNAHNMETWQKKNTFFTEHLPVATSIEMFFRKKAYVGEVVPESKYKV